MSDEIKEILDLDLWKEKTKGLFHITQYKRFWDYITNLQQENENLKEDNWAYHQLLRAGNKREYRSKFLKDFQKEYGENVFPDYDEIYKRYDDYKSRVEKAIELLKRYGNGTFDEDLLDILQGEDNDN